MSARNAAGLALVLSAFAHGIGSCQQVFVVDSGIYPDCALTTRPRLLAMPAVEYPSLLARYRIEGLAVITFIVDTSGRVEAHSLRLSQVTNPQFEVPIRDAVLRSRFAPGRSRGLAVRVVVAYRFSFVRGREVRVSRLKC